MSDVPDRLSVALADRYVLERELGRGGMATVYLARDVRHRRAVAVKVLRPELAAVLGPERFLREIEVAAQLNHPHILQLYDSGEAGGFLYYVMPLVDGESLRDRLERERQLPVEDALQIVREVADALAFAHSRRVVHRDVKPENILLAGGHAVIADFGIARAVTAAGGERLTQTGVSLGTPAYMSPEQWAGDEGLDGRSDLYSLGCVLYETLMGEPPFAGSSPQVILARQSMERIPSIRLVRPNVPPAVEAAITRAIAKLPADRFATTLQFAEALVAAPAPPSPEAAARPVPSRPFRRRAAAGVAIGVLLLGGTLGGLRLRSRATATGALVPGRVVVGQLENRTGDSTLNDVGSMAADWITQGLQSTGLVDVIPSPTALQASRFVAQQAPAGRRGGGRDPIAALAQETGAGTVISGRWARSIPCAATCGRPATRSSDCAIACWDCSRSRWTSGSRRPERKAGLPRSRPIGSSVKGWTRMSATPTMRPSRISPVRSASTPPSRWPCYTRRCVTPTSRSERRLTRSPKSSRGFGTG
ncbi:MAG: hypothetical protein AUH12_02045 [Gemmatimonadetes bacterium 13_2_20CM_69_8]|nr:MAG: hypothetical protein AUH12_02045 [Gemmatimonadetes bacterium 13_2_20CM_69_8]